MTENVIASAGCGYSSRATFVPGVHPTVVWPKFAALAEGAAIATMRRWGAEGPAAGRASGQESEAG